MTEQQCIDGQLAQIAYLKDEQSYKNLADENQQSTTNNRD